MAFALAFRAASLTRRALSPPQLCWNATNGACPEDLARRPLRDFADDGSGAAERVYRHVSYGLQTFVYTCPR